MAHTRCMLDKQGYTQAHPCTRPRARAPPRTHTDKYLILIAFPLHQWFANAPRCYITRIFRVLFNLFSSLLFSCFCCFVTFCLPLFGWVSFLLSCFIYLCIHIYISVLFILFVRRFLRYTRLVFLMSARFTRFCNNILRTYNFHVKLEVFQGNTSWVNL